MPTIEEESDEGRTSAAWEGDGNAPPAAVEDTMDQLRVMLRRESDAYLPCDDYLYKTALSSSASSNDAVCEAWRRKLCEWCYSVVDHFNFDREVVSYAISFLDRTVAAKSKSEGVCSLPQRQFQLLAVSSLYLAIKIHAEVDADTPRRKLRIGAYVELSRGYFSEAVIEATELDILTTLNYRVNPPTSLSFVALMLRLCPKWTNETSIPASSYSRVMGALFDVARYLTELSICLSSFTFNSKTSVTAYASIIYAMDHLSHSSLSLPPHVRSLFLNALYESLALTPLDPEVQAVYQKLDEVCPDLFQAHPLHLPDEESSSLVDGKVSPVCVADVPVARSSTEQQKPGMAQEDVRSPRKRSRSFDERDSSSRGSNKMEACSKHHNHA